jgi:hypothetical protein
MTRHTFWVIERFENGQSQGYWDGGNSRTFVRDIEQAIHFCREQDARPIVRSWHWQDVKITEHLYLAPMTHLPGGGSHDNGELDE